MSLCVTLKMKWLNFILIKLTCCLVAGILIGFFYPVGYTIVLIGCAVGLIVWVLLFLLTDNAVEQPIYLGVSTYALMVVIGVLVVTFHTQVNQKKHYVNRVNVSATQNIKIEVYKKLKPTRFYKKYLGTVVLCGAKKTTGIVLINTDSTQVLDIDDVVYASVKFQEINPALNPHQFDYKSYMQKQQVFHQVFLNDKNAMLLSQNKTLLGCANKIREQINITLKRYSISEDNLSVINALLLGQRQDISKNTYKSFTTSGTVHILAISGLHIGLLLLLLSIVFKPFTYFKYGNVMVSISIVLLLWSYAFIVGMSASVVRAVTMFSLFTIALYSHRLTNTYNTLVMSAFLLLLWDPYYVFDIGFQMSYSAVFAIIWIKPLFDQVWKPKFFISKKMWDVFSVTVAAQFGVLPLSLFYFHQFPGLFFISNMVIIPLLGFLLGLGIITLIFAYFGWIPSLLFELFNTCISGLLRFVRFISDQNNFIFTQLSFNVWNLVTLVMLIISIVLLCKAFSYKRIVFVLLSVVCVQVAFMRNKWYSQSEVFIVFNQYKSTLIGEKIGPKFYYSTPHLRYAKSIEDYTVNEFVQSVEKDTLRNVYQFKETNILVVDNNAIYNTSFCPEVVVLTGSPKLNLERLIDVLNPQLVVVDNNNYKSYVARWRQTCLYHGVPFHLTNEQGAFVLK